MKNQTEHFMLNLQLFAEEAPGEEQQPNPESDAIEALKKLKENTVSKEVYKKLEEQHRQLLNSIVNGEETKQEVVEKRPEFNDLVLKLSNTANKPLNNLEFWETALEFRKQAMEKGYPDPCTPHGRKVEATPLDEASVEKQLGIIEECIQEADGDPVIFNNELRRRGLK